MRMHLSMKVLLSRFGCVVLVAVRVVAMGAWAADARQPKLLLKLQAISAAALIGGEVKDPNDRHLGFIDHVIFDIASGAVRHVVLKRGEARIAKGAH
jgi:hypothetical protein